MNDSRKPQSQVPSDGDIVGNESTSQVVKAFRSVVKNVVQVAGDLVVSVPAWGLLAAAVVFVVGLILSAFVFIQPQMHPPTPTITPTFTLTPTPRPTPTATSVPPPTSTPMAFAPAREGESLIIVADFDDRSGGKYKGVDPAQYIYEKLLDQARVDGLDVRIERLRQVVDDNKVRPIGQVYSATLVLWGWYDALTITPRMERIKTLSSYWSTEEGQHLSLADPERIEFSIVTDLPSRASYIVLLTVGVDELAKQNYDQALAYFNSALASLPDGEISTNPSEVYLFRGFIYVSSQ
jgi:hypothetical protein